MTLVTVDNLEQMMRLVPCDIADELIPGCEIWYERSNDGTIVDLARWPDGRGAICFGGNSTWGDWRGNWDGDGYLECDDGGVYDDRGNEILDQVVDIMQDSC